MDKKKLSEGEGFVTETARLEKRCSPLIQLCSFAEGKEDNEVFPCRTYLRDLYIEATGMEEYIDGCGAQKNERWYPFREAVAAVKMFSHVYYDLLHIREATPYYSLLAIEGDFNGETRENLEILRGAIFASTRTVLTRVPECGLFAEGFETDSDHCYEEEPSIRFPADRETRHVEEPGKTVVYLATKFLNLAEEEDVREVLRQRMEDDYESYIPCKVNEEILRIVEARFHNLQSHYDTHIFESDIETQDRNLKILRGHISIIYHLRDRHQSGSLF